MKVLPISDVECVADDFCSPDRACLGYKCVPRSLVNITDENGAEVKYSDSKFAFTDFILVVIAILLLLITLRLYGKHKKWINILFF